MASRAVGSLFVVILLFIVGIVCYLVWDHYDMKKHQCQQTTESRQTMHWQNVYDGKGHIIGGHPYWVTENLYQCNDHPRWR